MAIAKNMKKVLLSAVSVLAFSISGLIFGQTTDPSAENPPAQGQVEDTKSDITNESPADQKEKDLLNKDKPAANPVNDSVDAEKTQKTEDTKDIGIDKKTDKTDKANKSENDKKIEQKQLTNAKNIPDKPVAAFNGLLEIEDGDFKYRRIPGISLNKEKRAIEYTPEVKINLDARESYPGENGKGLFGLKKSTSDILIKIILICLIIGIIILFKVRSRRHGDNKVLKRFPGAK